eukprot:CAMPEP_0179437578 /NCGR_PEP_ID=MMETSP0799-20121207/21449_1 /TAXON_ID=46947 /ORGANISM="Geminigera cryophila, Strain CCMP2564" /LENGTH=218 /DNA_ID=CAMNT_0021218611 /DNA_START=23 /DNA_END=679 /DNA_ORIENTATION=+
MPIKIHGMDISGNVFPAMALMSEEGIESELVLCNIMEGANKTPEFLKINPLHCIPTMDDDGFTLWESKAILRYICNKHKLEQWYPADYKKRALCDLALDFLGNSFVKVIGLKVLYPAAGFAAPVSPEDMTKAEEDFSTDLMPAFSHILAREEGPLIGGVKPNIADLAFMGYIHPVMLKCPDSFVAKNAILSGYYEACKAALPKMDEWAKGANGFWGAK